MDEVENKNNFRFIQISTDEVYGTLNRSDKSFTENTKYDPSSPYSASKTSADHINKIITIRHLNFHVWLLIAQIIMDLTNFPEK